MGVPCIRPVVNPPMEFSNLIFGQRVAIPALWTPLLRPVVPVPPIHAVWCVIVYLSVNIQSVVSFKFAPHFVIVLVRATLHVSFWTYLGPCFIYSGVGTRYQKQGKATCCKATCYKTPYQAASATNAPGNENKSLLNLIEHLAGHGSLRSRRRAHQKTCLSSQKGIKDTKPPDESLLPAAGTAAALRPNQDFGTSSLQAALRRVMAARKTSPSGYVCKERFRGEEPLLTAEVLASRRDSPKSLFMNSR